MSKQMEDIKNIIDKTAGPLSKEQQIKSLEKEILDMQTEIKNKYPDAQFNEDNISNITVSEEWIEEYTKKKERLSTLKR